MNWDRYTKSKILGSIAPNFTLILSMAKSRRTTASNIILTNTARRWLSVARGWIFTVGTDNFIRCGWSVVKIKYNQNSCKIIMMAYNAWFGCWDSVSYDYAALSPKRAVKNLLHDNLGSLQSTNDVKYLFSQWYDGYRIPRHAVLYFFRFRTAVAIVLNVFYNISKTHRATSMYI